MSRPKLDPALLNDFIKHFYGYGNYNSKIWFVGVEEGGGGDYAAIAEHLQCWQNREKGELEDLREFHLQKGVCKWFGDKPPLQRTWKGLLRVLMSSQGRSTDNKALREAQAKDLGRANGDHCLLELLPLPAPGMYAWPYAALSTCPELHDRRTYRTWAAPFRAAHLKEQIRQHRPKAVMFYGRSQFYLDWWKQIAGVRLQDDGKGLLFGNDDHTLFLVTPHMTARNVTNSYVDRVGNFIRSKLEMSDSHR